VYVDGTAYISTLGSTINNTGLSLSVGCHTISVELTNKALTPQPARFTAAIMKSGSTPIVTSDSSWRIAAGSSVHFSQPDYYADSSVWGGTVDYISPTAQVANSNWYGVGDIFTPMIAPTGNGCASLCPANSSAYLRDSKDFYVSSATDVRVAAICDDDCTVYLDGQVVISTVNWNNIAQQSLTLTPGAHHIAVRLFNDNSAANGSGVGITVVARSSGQVLTRTDRNWQAATAWTAGLNSTTNDIRSYEASFLPSPDEIARPTTFDALVVAGGGGGGYNSGGGGGGGGVRDLSGLTPSVTTYTVTVGAGGNGSLSGSSPGSKGSNSVFGVYTALGGGGGASRDGGVAASSGGSGGGGGGSPDASRINGAAGTTGHGYAGGDATTAPPDPGVGAKGGGGGGAGGPGVNALTTTAGHGGAGFISYITGAVQSFGGGGGGGVTASNGQNGVATDGGTGGVNSAPAATGAANRGGGGGGNGGTGGSGVVFVRIRTGSLTVSTTGSPTTTTATIDGIGYTIYKFTASGTFTISAIN
jgi:hypothetical protein